MAMNESAFRTANDRLRGAALSHHFVPGQRVPFICECSDPECRETVMLSIADYERVRDHPTWFLLVAGHEEPEADHERIIEAEQGYALVEDRHRGPRGRAAARSPPLVARPIEGTSEAARRREPVPAAGSFRSMKGVGGGARHWRGYRKQPPPVGRKRGWAGRIVCRMIGRRNHPSGAAPRAPSPVRASLRLSGDGRKGRLRAA